MRIWDEQRMADLVAERDRLSTVLAEVSGRLHTMQSSDAAWDEVRNSEYQREQLFHAQITRELSNVRAEITAMENFRPESAEASDVSAFTRWLRNGPEGLEAAEREIFLSEIVDDNVPNGGGITFVLGPDNTASDADSGQELVQETVVPRAIDRLAYYGGISRMAQQFRTATGNDYRVPQHDEASQEGQILGAQGTNVSDQNLADFGIVQFGARTASSRRMMITREMLQDGVFDVASFAERRAIRRMGRTWDKEFTVGAAGKGVVGITLPGIVAAAAAAVTYDELVSLEYAIDRAYREGGEMGEGGLSAEGGGRTGFMMSDSMEQLLRKLKDGDGRPIWTPSLPGLTAGAPSAIMGYPYEVSGPMDAVATGKIPLLFGNFAYFGIRTVSSIEVFRFMDSNTMVNNSIHIIGFSRRDAGVMGAKRPAGAPEPAASRGKCEAITKLTMG